MDNVHLALGAIGLHECLLPRGVKPTCAGYKAFSAPQPEFTACHQPSEKVTGTEIPPAWFAHGLRLVDIADPRRPREVGHFLPDVPEGSQRVQSNDVTTDDRGLFYLLDRLRGLTILERC